MKHQTWIRYNAQVPDGLPYLDGSHDPWDLDRSEAQIDCKVQEIRIRHPTHLSGTVHTVRMNHNPHTKWMDPAVYRTRTGTHIQTLSRTYTDGLTRAQLTS